MSYSYEEFHPTVQYLATQDGTLSWPGGAKLMDIVVGTGAASAVVTVYDGTSNGGAVKALIDASAAGTYRFFGARFGRGLFIEMTGGAAKFTVSVV